MKGIRLFSAAAILLVSAATTGIEAQTRSVAPPYPIRIQGGVGPVISGSTSTSSLPKKARKTIDRIGEQVTNCEREYMTDEYDVTLSSGVELEFDSDGNLNDIEAPDNGMLGKDLVKIMLPGKAYRHIEKLNLDQCVSSISEDKDGYKVDFVYNPAVKDAYFNHRGELIALHVPVYTE